MLLMAGLMLADKTAGLEDKVRELDGLLMEALSTQREQRARIATMVEGAEHERVLEELRVTSEQRVQAVRARFLSESAHSRCFT